jgi:glycerol uptake facilitator-like aquaporin
VDNVGKAAVAEFIGTFALIFFGAGAIIMTGGPSRWRTGSRSP